MENNKTAEPTVSTGNETKFIKPEPKQVDPNKMFFYIFLRVAVSYFKNFFKKEQDSFLEAENKRIEEAPNSKLKRDLEKNRNKGFGIMSKSHARLLDVSDYFLRHAVSKSDIHGQDYMDRVAVGVKMVIERVNKVEDFPRIAQMIEIYNTGALDDIFNKKEAVVSEDDKELVGPYPDEVKEKNDFADGAAENNGN